MSNQLLLPLTMLPLSGIIFLIILFMILNKVLKSPEAVEIEMKAGKKEFRIKKGNRRP